MRSILFRDISSFETHTFMHAIVRSFVSYNADFMCAIKRRTFFGAKDKSMKNAPRYLRIDSLDPILQADNVVALAVCK